MPSLKGKTAVVTGASSGIGKATAELLLLSGARVYAAARRIDLMKDLEKKGAAVVSMDVTNEKSVKDGINSILEKEGAIDILVNNAGYGSYGAVEDVPLDEARKQFEVNIFGLARLTQLVLPAMRERGFGRIVNISSMGGKIYTPFGAWYHATKHALEGFTDCLRLEVEPFGIDAVIVEPGGIKTDWGIIAADNLRKTSAAGAYSGAASTHAESLREMYSGSRLSKPEVVAKAVLKAATVRKPKTRYAVGYMSAVSIFIRKLLSDRAFDRLISSMM